MNKNCCLAPNKLTALPQLLHYTTSRNESASEWLVLLHGAGGSITTWKYQWDAFKPYFHLLALDLRDHGLSKDIKPSYASYSFKVLSQDIKTVLDHEGIDRAHFVSLSFGSVLLQDLSLRHPSLIKSAVMAGAIFQANFLIKSFLRTALFFNNFLPYRWMYTTFSYLLMPYKRHQKARKIYQKQARKLTPEEYMKWVSLYREFFRLLDAFFKDGLKFPALIAMGAEDHVFKASAQQMVSKNDQAELFLLNKAGHICNIDRPELFNEKALAFYERFSDGLPVACTLKAQ